MTTAYEFDTREFDAFRSRLQEGPTVLKISLNEGLRKLGRAFVPAKGIGPLADATPVRTGKLRRSTMFQIMGGPNDQWLQIRQGARSLLGVFYGLIVREGRGPIVAKKAKALRFEPGAPGSGFIFRRSVGPAAPNPYHKRVMLMMNWKVQQIVNEMGQKVTAYLSGR